MRGGRDVLVYAADLQKGQAPISVGYPDLLPISDQLEGLAGNELDLILETPGGSGEVAEDIIKRLRSRYQHVAVIVPGYAKSAGTIMAMAADDILMGPTSALGPIDAQMLTQGKQFSAHALLEGVEKIKREVDATGVLNKAYIPILQGLSPGELQNAQNALDFAKVLVTEWLAKYKFRTWTTHASNGRPVTDEERTARANEIADALCNHGRWLTHGRSLKREDLEVLRLKITDYSHSPDLYDAIRRYHTLLQMTFASNMYKLFETATSQVYRFVSQGAPAPQERPGEICIVEVNCVCTTVSKIQVNLGQAHPLQEGCQPFPADGIFKCPSCGAPHNLADLRRQLEMQTKRSVMV